MNAEHSLQTSHPLQMGDRGRLVIPIDVRERHGWDVGTPLVSIDTDSGFLVMSADEALTWLRAKYEERDLLGELLAERRAEVESENA